MLATEKKREFVQKQVDANYLAILQHELAPALGCTEPIAISDIAKCRELVKDDREKPWPP